MKYRKKPVVIEAVQWHKAGDHPKVERPWSQKSDYRCPKCCGSWGSHGVIRTLEDTQNGGHFVCPGDWIITGVQGEHYACKPDVFAATYEEAALRASQSEAVQRDAVLEEAEDAMLGAFADMDATYLFTTGFDSRIIEARDAIRALKRLSRSEERSDVHDIPKFLRRGTD